MFKRTVVGAAVAASVCLAGCAGGLNMEKHYRKYRANLMTGNYQAADEYIETQKKKFYKDEKNRLLYYMDRAMVLHLANKTQESNTFLEKAKTTAQDLWTDSIGENAASWLTTDNSISYQGEDFEKVLIHFVAALNFMKMNDYGAARVEARQITNKLELYNSKYEEEAKNVYKDDAFARWLSGKLAETEGGHTGLNDAWIDYKKAIKVYETDYAQRYEVGVPHLLVGDALRVLEGLGPDFSNEFNELKKRWPQIKYTSHNEAKAKGRVVLIHSAGEAPFKRDKFWEAQANNDKIRIAYPEFVPKAPRIVAARLKVNNAMSNTHAAEPVTRIAIQNLNDKMGRIKAKAIARAIAKYIAAKALQKGGDSKGGTAGALMSLGGLFMQAHSAIAEESDKRSWVTLPALVNIGQVYVEPGQVNATIEFLDAKGNVVKSTNVSGEVQAGKTMFVPYRTFM